MSPAEQKELLELQKQYAQNEEFINNKRIFAGGRYRSFFTERHSQETKPQMSGVAFVVGLLLFGGTVAGISAKMYLPVAAVALGYGAFLFVLGLSHRKAVARWESVRQEYGRKRAECIRRQNEEILPAIERFRGKVPDDILYDAEKSAQFFAAARKVVCAYCGAKNREGETVCTRCGALL